MKGQISTGHRIVTYHAATTILLRREKLEPKVILFLFKNISIWDVEQTATTSAYHRRGAMGDFGIQVQKTFKRLRFDVNFVIDLAKEVS